MQRRVLRAYSYNSAIFAVLNANEYIVYNVNEAFAVKVNKSGSWTRNLVIDWEGDDQILTIAEQLLLNAPIGTLQHLAPQDCIDAYARDFQSGRRNLLLVSANSTILTNSSQGITSSMDAVVYDLWIPQTFYDLSKWSTKCMEYSYSWICGRGDPSALCPLPCSTKLSNIKSGEWKPMGRTVNYCLSQVTPDTCKLRYSIALMAVVVAFNLCKLVLMLSVVSLMDAAPVMSIGDAIRSFVADHDSSTTRVCLLSSDGKQIFHSVQDANRNESTNAQRYHPHFQRWFAACSTERWSVFGIT